MLRFEHAPYLVRVDDLRLIVPGVSGREECRADTGRDNKCPHVHEKPLDRHDSSASPGDGNCASCAKAFVLVEGEILNKTCAIAKTQSSRQTGTHPLRLSAMRSFRVRGSRSFLWQPSHQIEFVIRPHTGEIRQPV